MKDLDTTMRHKENNIFIGQVQKKNSHENVLNGNSWHTISHLVAKNIFTVYFLLAFSWKQ